MSLSLEAASVAVRSDDGPDERTPLAHRVEQGPRPRDGTSKTVVRTAWRYEISSRVDKVLSGDVELVDADETYQVLSAELAEMSG